MSSSCAKLMVTVGDPCSFVKITGRANFNSSVDFKTLVSELMQKGYACFILDLTDCVLMDSTFLGVLAGFGLKLSTPQPEPARRFIELFNPNARVVELLENLGVLHLFVINRGEVNLPEQAETCNHTPANASREEMKRTCLEAHETLMKIHPDNVPRFKDITQFLAEDLKKLKANA